MRTGGPAYRRSGRLMMRLLSPPPSSFAPALAPASRAARRTICAAPTRRGCAQTAFRLRYSSRHRERQRVWTAEGDTGSDRLERLEVRLPGDLVLLRVH